MQPSMQSIHGHLPSQWNQVQCLQLLPHPSLVLGCHYTGLDNIIMTYEKWIPLCNIQNIIDVVIASTNKVIHVYIASGLIMLYLIIMRSGFDVHSCLNSIDGHFPGTILDQRVSYSHSQCIITGFHSRLRMWHSIRRYYTMYIL